MNNKQQNKIKQTILQQTIAFLFAALISFPVLVQSIHAFEHFNEKHCTETSLHLDSKAEHCNFCDIVPITLDQPIAEIAICEAPFILWDFISRVKECPKPTEAHHFSLRGPPSFVDLV